MDYNSFRATVVEVSQKRTYLILACDNGYVFSFTSQKLEEYEYGSDSNPGMMEILRYSMFGIAILMILIYRYYYSGSSTKKADPGNDSTYKSKKDRQMDELKQKLAGLESSIDGKFGGLAEKLPAFSKKLN